MIFNRTLTALGLATAAVVISPLVANAQTAPEYNYVGIGGGDDGLVVNGKFTLSESLSVRPAVGTDFDFDDGDDVNYTLPITYDFNAVDGQDRLFPFVGAGIDGQIGDNSDVEFAVTGGADYRINERFLVNGNVVWSPFADGNDDVSFTAGIGYSF
ncbi:MAG: YadA-like family protein [Cyanobacteria bacterium P01_A01_bin.105]